MVNAKTSLLLTKCADNQKTTSCYIIQFARSPTAKKVFLYNNVVISFK